MKPHVLVALLLGGCAGSASPPAAPVAREPAIDDALVTRAVETELTALLENATVHTARVVVMDPEDGRVVAALATDRERTSRSELIDSEVRAHGSVGKTFTLAAALAHGAVVRAGVVEGAAYTLEGETIADHELHGPMTVEDAFAFSSNVGFTHVYERLGRDGLYETYTALHLAHRIPGAAGESELAAARLAYGATLEATTLELAAAYSAIASGGTYHAPYRHPDAPTAEERVLDPAVASEVLAMLEAAVEREDGTGALARVEGVRVGGKTGTVPLGNGTTFGTFAGVILEGAPRLVILVGVEGEGSGYTGGTSAAPAFAGIVRHIVTGAR